MDNKIIINEINHKEALRYLGYGNSLPDNVTTELLLKCEKSLLEVINGRFIYKVFDLANGKINGCTFELQGESVNKHLKNCNKIILMCATLSSNVDKLIRTTQIHSMANATIIDSLASVAIEQLCDKAEEVILNNYNSYENTWRYGLGYGDFPLNKQREFLEVLDAPKRIGVNVNESMMLIPTKSVTCVIGLGHNLEVSNKKHCDYCEFREKCKFRKDGQNCGR